MPEEKKNEQWWKLGLEIFSRVSAWVVVPIVLALIAGKKLDAHYGTSPWIFLGLSIVGFLISSFGIVRTITIYLSQIKKEDDKSNESK